MVGYTDRHDPLQRARRDRPRGAARGARPGHRRADDHQPVDARHLRGPDRPGDRRGPRGAGAIAYMDGANLNAILGRFRPGEAGFDVMHFNLHKTFSHAARRRRTGRGAGRRQRAAGALPAAAAAAAGRRRRGRRCCATRGPGAPRRGALRARVAMRPDEHRQGAQPVTGNFGMFVRAYTYIRSNGGDGAARGERGRRAGRQLPARAPGRCLRPAVRPHLQARGRLLRAPPEAASTASRTLDIAKAILDHGIHPPTIYFPLIVEEALMIEPTETETLETLDAFVDDHARASPSRPTTDPEALRRRRSRRRSGASTRRRAARRPDLRHEFAIAPAQPTASDAAAKAGRLTARRHRNGRRSRVL